MVRWAQPLQKVERVFVRQIGIEHDNIQSATQDGPQRLPLGIRQNHLMTLAREDAEEHPANRRILIDQENAFTHSDKKYPVAGRGREPSHRERWVAAKSYCQSAEHTSIRAYVPTSAKRLVWQAIRS